jgi:hypothetical protein
MATLPSAAALTPQGRRFVAVLEQRSAALFDTSVRREVAAAAVAEVAAQKAAWTRRRGLPS